MTVAWQRSLSTADGAEFYPVKQYKSGRFLSPVEMKRAAFLRYLARNGENIRFMLTKRWKYDTINALVESRVIMTSAVYRRKRDNAGKERRLSLV